ncbi:MAG TPA: ABC transporter substrate-binding protein [Ohtaekwangia sp.]|uniref:ABC transporter substrate-binding protein n=1 Tax=Ohtaekwangia sp. TaxID=2066019 RepID=UPI002F93B99B
MQKISGVVLFLILCWACTTREQSDKNTSALKDSLALDYAEGFKVYYQGNIKMVEVPRPFQGASSGYKYLLVPKGEEIPPHDADVKVIRTPLASIACTSTTHIPLLDYIDETDKLTGFSTTDFISSEKMRARVDAGKVTELGIDKGINLERLAVLKPDMLMGYALSSDYGQFKKIEELGVPVVINAEYLEKHPLGRAEWIKFMAVFFNREKEADSVFQEIKKNYIATQAIAAQAAAHPSIICGVVYGDAWFLPGGQNYAARIMEDAGTHYYWNHDASNGYLELSFEAVYAKANQADLWIGTGPYATLAEIKTADERYTRFKAFQQKQVYTSDARKGAKGGSEYMELGYLRPDIILNDLVKIAHPELLPQHILYFHRKLE